MDTIRISDIVTSPTNPRSRLAREGLEDLTRSIAAHGILQPVLVRPHPDGPGATAFHYELVCGHRRLAAAQAAGLEAVPATVCLLSDAEALEVQVIENVQRADLHPLEEAEGYLALVLRHGYTVADLAAKVGKSRAHIYQRMQIAQLPDSIKALLWDDQLSPSLGLLIARIPDPKLQEQAAKRIREGVRDWSVPIDKPGHWIPLSLRAATELVRDEFMLEMKAAPFNMADAALVPEAGACVSCPKLTGNAPDLFNDLPKSNLCTDPGCFARKREAAWQAEAAAKRAKLGTGRRVVMLTVEQSERAFPFGSADVARAWVRPDAKADGDRKGRTWKQLLDAKAAAPPTAYLARVPKTGKALEIWKRAEFEKALGTKAEKQPAAGGGADEARRQPEDDWELERRVNNLTGELFAAELATKARAFTDADLIRTLGRAMGEHAFARAAKLASVEAKSAKKATPEDLRAVLAVSAEVVEEDLAAAFGIDYGRIEKLAKARALGERELAAAKAKAAADAAPGARAKRGKAAKPAKREAGAK